VITPRPISIGGTTSVFAEAYANALHQQRDYPKVESVLQELLRHRSELSAQSPAAYRARLAKTLNNRETQRFRAKAASMRGMVFLFGR
jgi:hypothetical protein